MTSMVRPIGWTPAGPSRYDRRTCRVHRLYALPGDSRSARVAPPLEEIDQRGRPGDQGRRGAPGRRGRGRRGDRGSTGAIPAQALGPDGRPAVSRRAPIWQDVPDEKWNDWRWQLSNRVNTLEEVGAVLQPDRGGEGGPLGAGQVPGRHHALLPEPHRPRRSRRPHPTPGDPGRARGRGLHGDDGGLAGRGPPLAGPGPRPPLPGPRPHARHDAVRELLPLLHADPDRRRREPELQPQGPRGAARLPAADAPGPRRPHLRRRRPDARPEALRIDPPRPPRDPPHRDHPDRFAGPRLPAPADRRRALRDAREVPPALDQPPLQPPQRDHPRGLPRGRQAHQGRPPGRQPERPPRRRQRLRPHPAGARPQARREPDPALLPLPVRSRRGLRALPDAGRQGPRDHGRPARPHLRLRGADLRHRCPRRRRQDPGHAELPHQLLGPQGRPPQLRGLHHDLRGARDLPQARPGGLRLLPERAPGAGPVRRPGPARGRAAVDRAGRLRADASARQHRGPSAPGPVQVGALRGRCDRGPVGRSAQGARSRQRRGSDDGAVRSTGRARSLAPATANRPARPTGSCSRRICPPSVSGVPC